MKNKIQSLKGFRDLMPAEAKDRAWLKSKMTESFENWGYEPLETPTLEPLELFEGEIGEDEKLFFKFEDFGGRKVALRYDQTVPTCRVIGQFENDLTFPFRRYQIQNVFRAEKPQKGRYREFTQADADVFGIASPIADAEVIAQNIFTLLNIGFKNPVVLVNNRELMKDIPYEAIVAVDKLKKIGEDGVVADMVNKNIKLETAKEYLKKIQSLKLDETLNIIFDYLKANGIPKNMYRFEPTLARSFSYSQGPIWELTIPEYAVGSIGGGERYDGLMERITGRSIPATGVGFGFDRTLEAAQELGLVPKSKQSSLALISVFDTKLLNNSLATAKALRNAKLPIEVFPSSSVKLAKQLKYANQKGIPYVIVIGEEEASQNKIMLKNMTTGNQQLLTVDEAIDTLTS